MDYLPADAILLICEPEQLAECANEYAKQVSAPDPFYLEWVEFQKLAATRGMTLLSLGSAGSDLEPKAGEEELEIDDLDFFRPLRERAPELQVEEAQRREFFAQLRHWLGLDFELHVF